MLRALLVPLDGSEFSERSLPLARALAQATGATLYVVHVHVPYQPEHLLSNTQFHYEGLDLWEYDEHRLEVEREYLEEVASRLKEKGLQVQTALLENGRVAEALAEHARAVEADLILMTTHGHGGVKRLWLGSVADALVRLTTRPLLVLHPHGPDALPPPVEGFAHLLVALDGSPRSEAILGPAAALARATGARMTLTHVIATRSVAGPRIFPLSPQALEPARAAAEGYLERLAQQLSSEEMPVDYRVVQAESAVEGITRVAGDVGADLIALATHGYGGLTRAVLGSVADKVLRSSLLPLLLEPPEE